jgi:hypothetical protein
MDRAPHGALQTLPLAAPGPTPTKAQPAPAQHIAEAALARKYHPPRKSATAIRTEFTIFKQDVPKNL